VTVKKLRGIDAEAGDEILVLDSVFTTAGSTGNVALSAYVNVMKLEVLVLFQEWREALDLVQKACNVRLILSCTFASVRYTFFEALTYLKSAQSSTGWKKRQMKKCAHVKQFKYLDVCAISSSVHSGCKSKSNNGSEWRKRQEMCMW